MILSPAFFFFSSPRTTIPLSTSTPAILAFALSKLKRLQTLDSPNTGGGVQVPEASNGEAEVKSKLTKTGTADSALS
jgi:hypothetical protein